MGRQTIVSRELAFTISRRINKAEGGLNNMHGMQAKVTLELMGEVSEETGRLIDPAVLDRIIEEKIITPFNMMMVLKLHDPLVETLSNKPLINNAGWEELVETMTEAINKEGYYDTRRQVLPPFYDDMRPLVIAEHPTAENLAFLIHRLLAPVLYHQSIQQMRVKFTEKEGHSAVFMGDVRPTPDYPQVP